MQFHRGLGSCNIFDCHSPPFASVLTSKLKGCGLLVRTLTKDNIVVFLNCHSERSEESSASSKFAMHIEEDSSLRSE